MKKTLITIAIALGIAANSMAINTPVLTGAYIINPGDWTTGTEPNGPEWYKANVSGSGSSEEGTGAPYFWTVFGNDPKDPKQFAQIFWDNTSFTPSLTGVYLKVGGQGGSGAFVELDINGVDLSGYSSILAYRPLENKPTGISHIRITGEPATNVPDGGSMLILLGGAVTVLGFLRRKISA